MYTSDLIFLNKSASKMKTQRIAIFFLFCFFLVNTVNSSQPCCTYYSDRIQWCRGLKYRSLRCYRCETMDDLRLCDYACDDCNGTKFVQERDGVFAENDCCSRYKKPYYYKKNYYEMQECKKENIKIRYCAKCETKEDLDTCSHTCNDCYYKKYYQEKDYYEFERNCCDKGKYCHRISKDRYCTRCQTWEDFQNCPHSCNDCNYRKWKEEKEYYKAEVICCRNDKYRGARQQCPNSKKDRYCTGCKTGYDLHWCPHTCNDCEGKKYLKLLRAEYMNKTN